MDFVNNVDFILALAGSNHDFFAELADVVDTTIRGGVNLNDVYIIIFNFVIKTVDFVGKNAGNGSFAGAAGASKQVGVRKLAGFDGFG